MKHHTKHLMLRLMLPLALAAPAPSLYAQDGWAAERHRLETWQAAAEVSAESVARYGEARCFAAEPIDTALLRRIGGKSLKGPHAPHPDSLRYLRVLHYTAEGRIRLGEMVCHRSISADLLAIFRALYAARYPIERMVLVDDYEADDIRSMEANNSSCLNVRTIGQSTRPSRHALGMAVDINPLYNPYVRTRGGKTTVSPPGGRPYADRSKHFRYKIDRNDLCYKLFRRYGFRWGGDWRSLKDYQHFEK